MPVTRASVIADAKGWNTRSYDAVPESIRKNTRTIKIFNIYSKPHVRYLGSLGTKVIPACQERERYSEPLEVPEFVVDWYDKGDNKLAYNIFDGAQVAHEIVSTNPGTETDLTRWGVFIAQGDEPTEAELQKAHAALVAHMRRLLQQADGFANEGPQSLKFIMAVHREAAQFLKVARPWNTEVVQMVDCPGCGEPMKPGIVRHSCGAILNRQRAIELGMIPADDNEKKGKTKAE